MKILKLESKVWEIGAFSLTDVVPGLTVGNLQRALSRFSPENEIDKAASIQAGQTLTFRQVQERLQVSRQTIYNMVERGQLKPVYIGERSPRFKEADLVRLVEEGAT